MCILDNGAKHQTHMCTCAWSWAIGRLWRLDGALGTKHQSSKQYNHDHSILDGQDHLIWWFDLDHMSLLR
jgi:hypothetical protein